MSLGCELGIDNVISSLTTLPFFSKKYVHVHYRAPPSPNPSHFWSCSGELIAACGESKRVIMRLNVLLS